VPAALAEAIDRLAMGAAWACRQAAFQICARLSGGFVSDVLSTSSVSSMMTAVWQLHTAGCRLMSWLAAQPEGPGSREMLPSMHSAHNQLVLLDSATIVTEQLRRLHEHCNQEGSMPGASASSASNTQLTRYDGYKQSLRLGVLL